MGGGGGGAGVGVVNDANDCSFWQGLLFQQLTSQLEALYVKQSAPLAAVTDTWPGVTALDAFVPMKIANGECSVWLERVSAVTLN